MAVPPLVASGDLIAAAHINALRNELVSVRADATLWAADISANGHKLTSLSSIRVASGSAGKSIRVNGSNTLEVLNAAENSVLATVGENGDLGALGGISGARLTVLPGALGNVAGNALAAFTSLVTDSNSDTVRLTAARKTNGSAWDTAQWSMYRQVDTTRMGEVSFDSSHVVILSSGSERARAAPEGFTTNGVTGINCGATFPYLGRVATVRQGVDRGWNAITTGVCGFSVMAADVSQTGMGLMMGVEAETATRHSWIQSVKPGFGGTPLLINAAGGGIVQHVPNARLDDGYLIPQSLHIYLDQATNQIHFRIRKADSAIIDKTL